MEFVQRIAVGCPGWCVHRKEWGGTNHLSNVCVYFYLASARHITTLSNLCIVSPSQHDGNQCKGTGDPIAEWKQRERTDSKLFVVSSWDSFGTLFSDLHCENNIELNIHVESPVILQCSRFLWLDVESWKSHESHSPRLNSPNLAPLRQPHGVQGFKQVHMGVSRWSIMRLDYWEKLYQASLKYTRVPTVGDKGRITRSAALIEESNRT